MKTKDFALQVKDLTDEGTFEGYGSIFGNVDSQGEKVMPGAFADSLARHKREGTAVLMLWQHNPDQPIGVWDDLAEDAKGLWGKGRLLLDIQRAREIHTLAKNRAIGGLSIGYREEDTDQDGSVRLLKKLSLYEISPVTFPANRRARIEAVKNALENGTLPSLPEFEKFLREAGFSKTQATAIANRGLSHLLRSESEGEANERAARFLRMLNGG